MVAMRIGASTLHFLLGDHLGSTSLTTNSTGGFHAELRYKPWGETRYTSGTTPTSVRFTGQHEESGLAGLYFYDARWYDPYINRWTQPDAIVPDGDGASIVPLTVDFHEPQFLAALDAENRLTLEHGFWFQLSNEARRDAKIQRGPMNPQDLNRYAYTRNNPLRYTDPSGHCIWDLCIIEGVGLVEITIIMGATAIYATYYASPNAAGNRAALAASIEAGVDQVTNGINAVFNKRNKKDADLERLLDDFGITDPAARDRFHRNITKRNLTWEELQDEAAKLAEALGIPLPDDYEPPDYSDE
jgi:RHS repeat-associated protein